MNSNLKTITIISLLIGIALAFSAVIATNLSFIAGASYRRTEYSDDVNLDTENLKFAAVSGKIHIDNNWTVAKSAGICTGSGTYSDPYVIEDLVIDGKGTGNCILIEDSNVFFKIENCTLYNSGGGPLTAGIKLDSVRNGLLIQNNVLNNYAFGIYLLSNEKVKIIGNTVSNNIADGIQLSMANNNTISGNDVNTHPYWGIDLHYSDNNMISDNTASNNDDGIRLGLSNNNIISGNTVNSNNNFGIELGSSHNNTIFDNTVNNNRQGIDLGKSYNNTISGNTANNNRENGIRLGLSHHNKIPGNIVNNNTEDGIYIHYSHDNKIMENYLSDNDGGIYLWGFISSNNTISGNTVNNNGYGIVLDNSDQNSIYLNCFNNVFNAVDNGTGNHWDNGIRGNFWADYIDSDTNADGIGDIPYNITGSAGSQDNFPLMKCPISAQDDDGDGGRIPGYNLFFLLGILSFVTIILSKKLKKS